MIKKRKFAVFDVDGTLFRSSLLIELTDLLVKNGVFKKNVSKEYEKEHLAWLDRNGTYEDYIWAVVKSFDHHIKKISYKDLKKCSDLVTKKYKNRTYDYTKNLIKDLKKKNYFILAVSHSPKIVLDPFCKELGFDKVYGRRFELNSKKMFTGNQRGSHIIKNKESALRLAIEKENLTLKDSIGVGDTESDIQFLKVVENPICFNPNAKLFACAQKHKWPVVVERKDVIYKL
ncbi:MAG: HAD-IB family hydrolase [Candidatus Paceibacterota bacterium]|jgi:HAD superfamily hydrolase (TIGR01490 family)